MPGHWEELYDLQREKEGEIAAKAMSCEINTSDQCFINKKMSYFTFLCGPLSLGWVMECQTVSRPQRAGRLLSARHGFRCRRPGPRGCLRASPSAGG